MIRYASDVRICEVGPRDGPAELWAQDSDGHKSPHDRPAIRDRVAVIEATGFVHPKVIPNLDDAGEVMARITRRPRTIYRGLAPNEHGAHRAVTAGVGEVVGLITVSRTCLAKNQKMDYQRVIEQSLAVHEIWGVDRRRTPWNYRCGSRHSAVA